MRELKRLRESNEYLMRENERLEKENKRLNELVDYLRKSCKQFAHLWIQRFNPEHKLSFKKKQDY